MACLTLADLSLSTESWVGEGRVIDVIRDSLLLFAEALSASGDGFGLYGFSSIRRQEVRLQVLKDFADRYDDNARGRIMAIRPGYYTRMGAAIRQSSRILLQQAAQRRLLLIISDGKPNDLDHYEGRYGIEDTRQAILEARRDGLVPFCVTVDREGSDYLPHLFGHRGYVVVQQAQTLPQVLTRLYASFTR
ncbi:nitric oxide reductase activation protein NorD [Paludibacterium denitrificans]|uniref:nitric oxide reductase activation protein NorD n=1 Tax=Paludibacterium denitrificans TaxID=2675226 RepID=UPI001E46B52E|nr:VWA domain-containing protein [Paludibacterium denitrificans]